MEITKNIQVPHVISPHIFSNPDFRQQIADELIEKFNRTVHNNELIIDVIHVFIDNIPNPPIDPISGNMKIQVYLKCRCLKVNVGDILTVEVCKIIEKGILGVCCEGMVKTLVTNKNLIGWKFENNGENVFTQKHVTIRLKSVINVEIIGYEYEMNVIKCSAKFISQN